MTIEISPSYYDIKSEFAQATGEDNKKIYVHVYRNGYTGPYKLCDEAGKNLDMYGYYVGTFDDGEDRYIYDLSSYISGTNTYADFYIENTDVSKRIWVHVLGKDDVGIWAVKLEPSTRKLELGSEPQIIDIAVNLNGYEGNYGLLWKYDESMVSVEPMGWNATWTSYKLKITPLKCGASEVQISVDGSNVSWSIEVNASME